MSNPKYEYVQPKIEFGALHRLRALHFKVRHANSVLYTCTCVVYRRTTYSNTRKQYKTFDFIFIIIRNTQIHTTCAIQSYRKIPIEKWRRRVKTIEFYHNIIIEVFQRRMKKNHRVDDGISLNRMIDVIYLINVNPFKCAENRNPYMLA